MRCIVEPARSATLVSCMVVLSLLIGWQAVSAKDSRWSRGIVELARKERASWMHLPSRPVGAEVLQEDYASRIIVSEVNKFVFCPVPKVANSNWKFLIRQVEGFSDYANLTLAHRSDLNGLRYLSDYSADEVDRILSSPDFFKFAFVRDPYTRLVSAYLDKFWNKDTSSEEYKLFVAQIYSWKYVRDKDLAQEPRPSFRAFIDELLKQNPTRMNLHWMPQTFVCGFGDIPYDFLGRFENFNEDVAFVLNKLGLGNIHFPSQEEIGFPPSGALSGSAELYTLELMLKVKMMYEIDFAVLGYE